VFLSFRIDSAEFIAETGNLLIQTRNSSRARYLLSSWEHGLDLFVDSHQGWVFLNQGPDILLWGASYSSAVHSALDSFCATIPHNIQSIAAPYRWRQLSILRLLRINRGAYELAKSSPLLFWLLADRVNEGNLTLDKASSLLFKRRDEILKHLIGHASRSLIKFLNKLKPLQYDHQEVRLVYQILGSREALFVLRHCREIHLDLLSVVIGRPECLRIPMVRSLLEHPDHSQFLLKSVKILVSGCLRAAREQDVPDLWASLYRCRYLSELKALNQELNNHYNIRYIQQKALIEEEEAARAAFHERTAARRRVLDQATFLPSGLAIERTFPEPPFPGNEFIKPITSPEGLRYEGSKNVMDNCVKGRDYIKTILKGNCYIYRVYKPQRCTLEIEKTPSGNWRISQLKLRKNESPRPETKNFVQEWLSNENQKNG